MAFVIQCADRSDLLGGHVGVAEDVFGLGKALILYPSRLLHALTNLGRVFPVGRRRQFPIVDRRDVDMDINPIHQGLGNFGHITLNNGWCAGTATVLIPKKATRATVRDRR